MINNPLEHIFLYILSRRFTYDVVIAVGTLMNYGSPDVQYFELC